MACETFTIISLGGFLLLGLWATLPLALVPQRRWGIYIRRSLNAQGKTAAEIAEICQMPEQEVLDVLG